jgi:hypothetical protein
MRNSSSEVPQIRRVGPVRFFSAAGQAWWDEHQVLVEAWIRGEYAAGLDQIDLAEHAASSLIRIPESRAEGHLPGEPIREPYCWDEIDAYEILFQQVVHGVLMEGWDPAEYVRLIGAFAAYLGERGVIPAAEHARLQEEYGLWAGRLLEVWANHGWYHRDGTHRRPGQKKARRRWPRFR